MNDIMPKNIHLVSLKDKGITEDIRETGKTLEENSKLKAQYIFGKIQLPVIADDSGLLVHSLNNEPGVFSARYAGEQRSDDDNMHLLLKNLISFTNRTAVFQTIITYINEFNHIKQFKGEIKGSITHKKRGNNGFGYDPIFQPDGYDLTFAELDKTEKNTISHRANAVRKLMTYLCQKHV